MLWTTKSSLQMDHLDVTFETDCQQVVKIIVDEEEEDCSSLLVKSEEFHYFHSMFNYCSLRFIPRSCSVRADCLAKGARARGIIIFHVNSRIQNQTVQTDHTKIL